MKETCRRWNDAEGLARAEGLPGVEPAFEAHLAACAICRTRAERLAARVTRLRELPRLEPPAELWDRIARRRVVARPLRKPAAFWSRAACLAAVAASVAAAVVLALEPSSRPGRVPEGVVVVDAEPSPDVLTWVAEDQGSFLGAAENPRPRERR